MVSPNKPLQSTLTLNNNNTVEKPSASCWKKASLGTNVLYLFALCCFFILQSPSSSISPWSLTSAPSSPAAAGYSQGSVVSGAIFLGTPFRTYPGGRVFTPGWEKRVGKKPLTWERLLSLTSSRIRGEKGGTTTTEAAATPVSCSKWSVVTTIFEPSEAIIDAATKFGDDWCIVIVGDKKTPANFLQNDKLKGNPTVFYFDVAQQETWTTLPGEIGEFVRSVSFC
jgi:hypothetical protein